MDVRSFIVPGYTLMVILIDGLVSGVFHGLGLGLGLGLSHTVELWYWCLQSLSLSLGGC